MLCLLVVTQDAPGCTICQDALLLPLVHVKQTFVHHAGCVQSLALQTVLCCHHLLNEVVLQSC